MTGDTNKTISQTQTLEQDSCLTCEPSPEQSRQLQLEKKQRDLYLGRLQSETEKNQIKGRGSQTKGGKGVRYLLVPFVGNWLRSHIDAVLKKGRAGFAVRELIHLSQYIEPETMAHIAVSCVLDSLGRGSTITTKITAVKQLIGEQLEHQAQLEYMQMIDPSYFNRLQKIYLHDPVRRYDRKITAMRHAHNKHEEMSWKHLTSEEQIRIGAVLLQAVCSIQIDPDTKEGFFQRIKPLWNDPKRGSVKRKQESPYYLGYTKTGLLYRDKLQKACDQGSMDPRPMVCTPMDWTPTERGGYLSHVSRKVEEMIHNNSGSEASQTTYDALNRLQHLPFKVNRYIYNIQKQLLQKTWEIGSFRSYEKDSWEEEHFPLVDSDYVATLEKDSDEYKKIMRTLTVAYHTQRISEQKANAPRRTFLMASEFVDEERFWFPWFLDSRGRLYPTVNAFSPQGADYGKGLLMSADGMPLTDDSRRELLISIATAGAFDGIDKADFFTRLQWAETFVASEDFCLMVDDPLSYRFWMEADEPFQFIALCEEYKAIFVDGTRDRVAVFFGRDQTCSGVQILSAVIKDPKAALYTNVVVTEKPMDLYKEVAKEAQLLMRDKVWLQQQMEAREAKRVKANANRKPEHQYEARWIVDVDPSVHDRKANKTQAMCTGYGATLQSRYQYIREALKAKEKKEEIPPIHPADMNIVCRAGIEGMSQAFPRYMNLNKWFKKFAAAVLKSGKEQVTWTTPSGMTVSQEYREPEFRTIRTHAAGGGHYDKLNLCKAETATVDTGYGAAKLSKNQSAIAANWTHSLDGSIMQIALCAVDPGIPLFTVHDCAFGLSGYFNETIPHFREAMHTVVTSPVLENLLEENGLTGKIDLPEMGELDVSEIKESPYLFS